MGVYNQQIRGFLDACQSDSTNTLSFSRLMKKDMRALAGIHFERWAAAGQSFVVPVGMGEHKLIVTRKLVDNLQKDVNQHFLPELHLTESQLCKRDTIGGMARSGPTATASYSFRKCAQA